MEPGIGMPIELDRAATAPVLRRLNADAVQSRLVAVTAAGLDALHPDAEHQGTLVCLFDEVATVDGYHVASDATWVGVAWAAMLRNGGGNGMFMACKLGDYLALPATTMPEEHREQLRRGARNHLIHVAEKTRFLNETLRDIRRLPTEQGG